MTGNDILQIPRRTEVPNGAAMVGIKHGPDLLAVYSAGGRLMYIFDSVREVDIIVEDPLSDQPVTSADLSSARTVNFDDRELDGTTTYFIGGDTGAIKLGRSVNAAVRPKDIQACSPIPQNGREWCRERGCRYVWSTVVAGSNKKKKRT